MIVKFVKRGTVRTDVGQLIIGQESQICDLEGEALKKALADKIVEPVEQAKPAKAAKAAKA